MTIQEAIEILEEDRAERDQDLSTDLDNAYSLGIEALRRIAQIRVIELDPELHHLPGETFE